MARPSEAVTLTQLPRAWAPIRDRLQRFARALKRRSIRGAYAYNAEPNPGDDDGAHCHLWWRGDLLDQEVLSELAVIAGMGRTVDVRPAWAETAYHSVPTIDYGLKLVLRDRPEAPEEMWPSASAYLALNGGHLIHQTHGFWQDWSGDAVAGGIRKARRLARQSGPPPPWGRTAA